MAARDPQPVPRSPEAVAEGLNEAMIREVVHHFYAAAREDPVIGPVFRARVPDDRWQAHLDKIEDFWCSSLLGTRRYDGRPMPKHLAISELNDDHFRRWLALFRHTVTQLCPPKTAQLFVERSERIAEAFRINIGMARGEDLMFRPKLTREPYP
ncbi:hemoglobin-like protein [Roseivivax marinus]|uniref:Hemoglobin-like protein n=1 Tax=Roseivivax marinus TaxID=1379903 RepID=W4HRR8_9RHOB|nr:group III truncated hemoglobin [Roseivivax marinus]ETW14816.1 hemoglobin-like protein [Roseivivax marinus]UMA65957.1 group III truncated hemoglobin [Roseivivax marinus]